MGGKSSKQTTENKPPEWSKPLFEQSASEASRLYNSGSGGNVYQGQTVAGLSPTTQTGINNLVSSGNNLASSGNSVTQGANALYNRSMAGTAAATNLQGMASGQYLKEGNPHFNAALQGQLDDTAAQTQSQFSGSGRYGSGANTGVLANKLGNIRSTALADQFNRDSQNMLAANSQLDAARVANVQNANSSLQNMLTGAQAGLTGAQAQVGAGQMIDENKQKQLIADFTKWQSEDMKDWNRLGLLQSAAAGSAGNYGTNTQTQTQPFNALGAIGSLGGLFKSDRRLKEAVFLTGYHYGLPVYDFAYKGSRTRWRGIMAQDVIELAPEAVVLEDDGFFAVDYGMIGFDMQRAA